MDPNEERLLDHRGTIRITFDQIMRMLDLPEGTQVRAVNAEFDPPNICIGIVHPDLPAVEPYCEAPILHPPMVMVERLEDDRAVLWYRSTVKWEF